MRSFDREGYARFVCRACGQPVIVHREASESELVTALQIHILAECQGHDPEVAPLSQTVKRD